MNKIYLAKSMIECNLDVKYEMKIAVFNMNIKISH